jgi:5-methylcytosine-specific restriction protein B
LINFKPNETFTEVVSFLKSKKINTLERSSDFDEYKEFIKQFPASELTSLSLDQYCIGRNDNANFCWWIERGLTKALGRFSPGSSKGHIIYYEKNGDLYKNRHLQALTDNEALIFTLKIQSVIANADPSSDLSWIDNDDEIYKHAEVEKLVTIGNARKLRLLSCYNPELFIPISSSKHLGHFLKVFGCPDDSIPSSDKPIARMLLLLELYKLVCKEIKLENLSTFAFMQALYSEELNIAPKKDENFITRVIPKIWKISHGNDQTGLSQDEHDSLFKKGYVAVGGVAQLNAFEKINPNDYFYLVRNAEIILLGQLEDTLPEEVEGITNRLCRKFKPVRILDKPYPVERLDAEYLKRGGMPSSNSTVQRLKNEDLKYFESAVLKPVFDLQLKDLNIVVSFESDNRSQQKLMLKEEKNQILYGPPGTGKTYNTVNKAIKIANTEFNLDQPRKEIKTEFDRLISEGQIVFTTFHQSMCYEDFIEGIKPLTDDSFVKYDVQPGIFKQICDKARSNFENAKDENKNRISFEAAFDKLIEEYEVDPEIKFQLKTENKEFTLIGFTSTSIQFKKASGGTSHTLSINTLRDLYYGEKDINRGLGIYYQSILNKLSSYNLNESFDTQKKEFVLIIDEINRGNVSQIFGELITLIEDNKRLDKEEQLSVILPYSKEPFNVPSNLYIIGTMNTADRSVEALDAALRRRFSFEEMPPNSKLIATEGKLKETEGVLVGEINLPSLLDIINYRLEKLLDKDHQIGHSYFISVNDLDGLKLAFQNKIIPLLQEYFFGDYGKIGLVLGKGFFVEQKELVKYKFAEFDYAEASDFSDRIIFKIKTFEIGEKSDDDFIKAINLLLNKKNDG